MVMPKLPFSLFDFKYIDKIEPIVERYVASAGDAIAETTVYECPKFKFALVLSATIQSAKITSTVARLYIKRMVEGKQGDCNLIHETLGTTEKFASWPPSKTPAQWVLAWHLLLMFPGDQIRYSHDLTAAETIVDHVKVIRIEYSDPRYP